VLCTLTLQVCELNDQAIIDVECMGKNDSEENAPISASVSSSSLYFTNCCCMCTFVS
jgi:hypothetical protein